jgi:hypothetical protein
MDIQQTLDRLENRISPWGLAAVALLILASLYGGQRWLHAKVLLLQGELRAMRLANAQSDQALTHFEELARLKTQDVAQFKQGMSNLAQSKKTLFETGLSLQEEKRLLEKQWEIMTTYLTVDTVIQRIFLMRGDQPLESYLIEYVPLKAFAGVAPNVPRVVRVTSKERFAHPERGKSEMVNGQLKWEPPQVGTSVRSNALGEYVLFTNSKLILHGPPKTPEDHEAYPHLCLGLSLDAARNLYQHSFIGSKILLASMKEELARQATPGFPVNVSSTTSPVPPRNAN